MKSLGQGPELIKQSGTPTRPASPHPLCQDAVCHAVFLLAPGQAGSGDGVHTMGWSPLAQCPDPVRAPLPSRIWASSAERPRGGCGWHRLAQGKVGGHRWGCGFSSAGGEDDGSCEVNGRVYRDGETFQPHCRVRCHCEDGGFTCVPLCSEDVRLPSWDCPYPRRVEVPGKCCPEWVCDQGGGLGAQPLPAQGECRVGPGQGQGRLGAGRGRGFSGARTLDWSKPGAGPPGRGAGRGRGFSGGRRLDRSKPRFP